MRRSSPWRQTLATWFPAAVALLAAVILPGRLEGPPPASGLPTLLALVAVGAAAALHRPWGSSTLGLAALTLPIAADRLGGGWAAGVAASVAMIAPAVRSWWARALDPAMPRERWIGRAFETAGIAACGALVGAWVLGDRPPAAVSLPVAGSAAAYAGSLALLIVVGELIRRRRSTVRAILFRVVPLAFDAAAWTVGALTAPWPSGAWLLAVVVGLLAFEAARNGLLRAAAELRVERLRRIERAHQRILSETAGLESIAEQILTECENVLPVAAFELRVTDVGGESRCWAAGPDGRLTPGQARPPSQPSALPGIHRRAEWRILGRELVFEDQPFGQLRVWCDPRRIRPAAEELFDSLVPQMAASLHRARLDREAKHDALTGLPVRRVFDQRLQTLFLRSREEGGGVAVVLCDLDHFKKINDSHGHAAGDAALRAVAEALRGELREGDLCCRYGGEEFALLLSRASGVEALRLAERLRAAVERVRFRFEGREIPLRLSAGAAAFPELMLDTASELPLLADEALYEAKGRGRNRCLLHLGRGRFQTAAGRVVRGRGKPPARLAAPRIFG